MMLSRNSARKPLSYNIFYNYININKSKSILKKVFEQLLI